MKNFSYLAVAICIVASATLSAQTASTVTSLLVGSRIAYFSMQRVFAESNDGKAAIAKLTALQAEKSKPVEEKQKALVEARQAFEATTAQLNEAARNERMRQLERTEIDARRVFEDMQKEMMGVQRDTESAFLAKLKPILEEVVKEKSLLVLFNEDAGTIAWGDVTLDLTSDIVKRLDGLATKKP